MTTHTELKKLVKMRSADARVLLNARRYAGAYYMAGYAVECAIKVVLAKQFKVRDIPDKKKVQDIHQHNLKRLIQIADLEAALRADTNENVPLASNWGTVNGWSEVVRYNPSIGRLQARDMLAAIEDPTDGVIQWLIRHW